MFLLDVDVPVAYSYGDVVSTADVVRVLELVIGLQIVDCFIDLIKRPGKWWPADQREFQASVVGSHFEY